MFLTGMLARGRIAVKILPVWRPSARWRWLMPLGLMGAIFYLSHQTAPVGGSPTPAQAMLAHMGIYGVLAAAFFWALAGTARRSAAAWLLVAISFALATLYGVVDEVHQAYVPGRDASEVDLALDAVGALLGAGCAALVSELVTRGRSDAAHP